MKLRFSIRDLLWLAVVAALAVGWWLDHKGLMEKIKPRVKPWSGYIIDVF